MLKNLRTLATTSVAYGIGSISAKLLAIALLPLYTRYLTPADYGIAELVLTIDLFFVATFRFGLQNAMMRYWHRHAEDGRQADVVRSTLTFVSLSALLGALVLVALAEPVAALLFGSADRAELLYIGALGMWGSAVYGTLSATFRLQHRPRAFISYALAVVVLTAAFTVLFVVVLGYGAEGMLAGKFLGQLAVLPVMALDQRQLVRPSLGRHGLLRSMIRFGIPTLPMGLAIQARPLVDRTMLSAVAGNTELGLYALSWRVSQVVALAVTALQLSWQPFAYSIKDDDEARETYAAVMSWYVAVAGWLVVTTALLAEPAIRLLTTPPFYGASQFVPVLAAAAGIYGVSFIGGIPAGRVDYADHFFHGAITAVVVTLVANSLLIPRYEGWGAAWSLLLANTALAVVMVRGSQRHFRVPYQWSRVARCVIVIAPLAAAANLLPPGDELASVLVRTVLVFAYPLLVLATGFLGDEERAALRRLRERRRARRA